MLVLTFEPGQDFFIKDEQSGRRMRIALSKDDNGNIVVGIEADRRFVVYRNHDIQFGKRRSARNGHHPDSPADDAGHELPSGVRDIRNRS